MAPNDTYPRPYRVLRAINAAGVVVAGAAVALMMLLIVVDVIGRVTGMSLIAGVFEISENYLMPMAIFPALGFVYASGVMPRFDVILERFPQIAQKGVVYVLLVLEIIVFAALVWMTFGDFTLALADHTTFIAGGTAFPLWPVKLFVPLGFAMIVVETLYILVENLRSSRFAFSMSGLVGDEHAEEGAL